MIRQLDDKTLVAGQIAPAGRGRAEASMASL